MGQSIHLTAPDGTSFAAYVAQPLAPLFAKPRGAVVVLQEIFGVNAHIRAVADGYAREGYWVIAPSTFARVKPGVELGYTPEDIGVGFGLKAAVEALPAPGVLQDIQTAVDHALQASAGRVAVLGYCWGGLLTWRSACELQRISAAVPYYGGGMTEPGEAERIPRCPVLAHFGDRDPYISNDSVAAFAASHATQGVQVEVYSANHGFNCDQRASHDAAAAALARERTLAFLAQHIG